MPWVSWSFFWMLSQVCEANWKPGLAGHNLLTLETGDWKGRCEVWTSNPRQSLTVGSWPWWTQYALLRRPNWEPESDTCRNRGQLPQTPPNWELESDTCRNRGQLPQTPPNWKHIHLTSSLCQQDWESSFFHCYIVFQWQRPSMQCALKVFANRQQTQIWMPLTQWNE